MEQERCHCIRRKFRYDFRKENFNISIIVGQIFVLTAVLWQKFLLDPFLLRINCQKSDSSLYKINIFS